MSQTWIKYPRTYHLPNSPGMGSDDKRAKDLSAFDGQEVVVTEKMDGENTTIYADGYHARSLDSGFHPSRARLAALQGEIGYQLKPGWRVCGENVFARHSVAYDNLPAHFLVFSIWNDENTCLSWDETLTECRRLDLNPVPELYRGPYSDELPQMLASQIDTDRQEGFVLRLASRFPYDAFSQSVVKWVRAGHVQSDTHWKDAPLVPNKLTDGGPS